MDDLNIGRPRSRKYAQRLHLPLADAILTLKSMKTWQRFTYKVQKSEDGKAHVKVLTGPLNS